MPHWRAPWAPAVSKPPPSSLPRRPAAPKPAWDVRCGVLRYALRGLLTARGAQESISDLRQYSFTAEELVRCRGGAISAAWRCKARRSLLSAL